MGDVVEERNPFSGRTILRRLDVSRPQLMYEYGTFRPTETEQVPAAYMIPGDLTAVLTKLADHGVQWTQLTTPYTGTVERFVIDSTTASPREFQGHNERTLYGRYEETELTMPAGAVVVSLDQPLGRLAFYLLEPRSDDGFVNWNVLDEALEGVDHYPIVRTLRK